MSHHIKLILITCSQPEVKKYSDYFVAINGSKTFYEAAEMCESIGLELPVPTSSKDNEELQIYCKGLNFICWLGITQNCKNKNKTPLPVLHHDNSKAEFLNFFDSNKICQSDTKKVPVTTTEAGSNTWGFARAKSNRQAVCAPLSYPIYYAEGNDS